jgi:tetratricopeptide (TPR) repeat protein
MRWQQTEFILKGIYLGLVVSVALSVRDWSGLGFVAAWSLGGLAVCLGVAAVRKLREGYRVRGRLPTFVLFLLLENPGLVYAGVLLGLALGAFSVQPHDDDTRLLLACVGGGAVLGFVFWLLRHTRNPQVRLWGSLTLAAALVGGAITLYSFELAGDQRRPDLIGAVLLLGMPLFYLLTFASIVEESEVEVGAMCAALGVGLWLLVSGPAQNWALVVPVAVYVFYTRFILSGLKVFKHVLRGVSYATVGQYRWALASFTRALQLDPGNRLAREQLWSVHRRMDFDQVANDPETLALVSYDLCLDRVGSLLLTPPQPEQLQEAYRLLDLVAKNRPDMRPRCDYWRSVALTHERRYDEAAAALEAVVASHGSDPANPQRWVVLMDAWQFALSHPEMQKRVGTPQIALPGRRLEAIAAVERRLAGRPEDAGAWDLKRPLYSELTEEEFRQAYQGKPPADFDYGYAQQLGLALIDNAEQWQRGAAYLRMAAAGLPATAPTILVQVAKASEKNGHYRAAWDAYELARDAGRAAGPKNLSEADRHTYFAVVKMLADAAREDGKVDPAIENYLLYTQYERAGLETYRALAELYERKLDRWSALHATAQALVYDSRDKDLLERRDRYYYSVKPEELRARLESVVKWFDVDYCLDKARRVLDQQRQGVDLDLLDWASHLLDLANVARPASVSVRVLRARVRRLRGEIPEAVALLEEVRMNRPEKFANADEEESWYLSCRLLGDLYLEERPDLAVQCFNEYRNSPKSGADTYYKLGLAYEGIGDRARAARCYQQVVAYETHPLAPNAHEALARLQAS